MNCLQSSAVAVSKTFEQKHASAFRKSCHLRTGLCQCKIYGADIFTNEMVLTTAENFVNNFAKCIVGIAELFGALPNQKIVVTSAFGIHYLSHMAAFLLFVIILIATIKTVHPLSGLLKTVRQIPRYRRFAGMVCCIIAVNLAVLILTDTTYGSETFEFRYHLIPVVSGFLVVGIGIGGLVAWLKAHPNPLIFTSAMALIAIIWLLCNIVFTTIIQAATITKPVPQLPVMYRSIPTVI